jgi:hypothetical protein
MKKQKKKRTAAEKAARKRRREEYMTIFIGGKQKRVKRPPTIEGMDVDEFIRRNADPIWLLKNEMWEELYELEMAEMIEAPPTLEPDDREPDDTELDDIPF